MRYKNYHCGCLNDYAKSFDSFPNNPVDAYTRIELWKSTVVPKLLSGPSDKLQTGNQHYGGSGKDGNTNGCTTSNISGTNNNNDKIQKPGAFQISKNYENCNFSE